MINKICLGTVQFGMNYGINNISGKPDKKQVFNIIDYAVENGIEMFDTASAYGEAERVLGEYIKYNNNKEIKIITKIQHSSNCSVVEEFDKSLKRLNVDYVEGLLLHNGQDLKNADLIKELTYLKESNLAKKIGVSIYLPKEAMLAANSESIDIIQVPYNILDRRLDKIDFFDLVNKNKKSIFARSVFLQGLLLMDIEKIPEHLTRIKKHLKIIDEKSKKYNFTKKEICLLFAYLNKNINYIVIGVDTLNHLKEIMEILKKAKDFSNCFDDLYRNIFNDVENYIISPNLWRDGEKND